jgi:hypothetical protein
LGAGGAGGLSMFVMLFRPGQGASLWAPFEMSMA